MSLEGSRGLAKVLFLVPTFGRASPIEGVFLLARHLHQSGHPVVFAALARGDHEGLERRVANSGVPHVSLDLPGWRGLLRAGRSVRRLILEESVDVVLSTLLKPDLVNASVSGVVRLTTVRIPTRDGLKYSHGRLIASTAGGLHALALRRMDGVFSLSDEMTRHLEEAGVNPSRVRQVNNFVDVDEVRDLAAHPCDVGGGDRHIGIFGRLISRKRVDIAIRAFAEVRRSPFPEAILHVVGDGPLLSALRRMVTELRLDGAVRFHGYLPNSLPLMAMMDVVILTSESEGTPRCIMEAMALGKTCVTSDIGGVRHLVVEGRTGYRVRSSRLGEYAYRIGQIISGEGSLLPESVERFARGHFDVKVCGDRMAEHIQDLYLAAAGTGVAR